MEVTARGFCGVAGTPATSRGGGVTLRVCIEEVQFNLNQSLKQLDFEEAHCMRVEDLIPDREEMMYECMNQDPLEECMLNSLYNENLDGEKLNASVELIETVLNLSEENEEDVKSSEMRVQEAKKSSEGLILKELPKHLKYTFLGEEKSQPIIIS